MPGLENEYVNELGNLICGDGFLGVFPSDIQPQIKVGQCKFSVIFNTDEHTEKGSHFVAIFRNKSKFFYFDSFGKNCKYKNIKMFIKKNLNNQKYIYNNKCIQAEDSLFCGFFCISFINSLNKNSSLDKFISNFSLNNLTKNDNVVSKMITKVV